MKAENGRGAVYPAYQHIYSVCTSVGTLGRFGRRSQNIKVYAHCRYNHTTTSQDFELYQTLEANEEED